MNWTFLGWLFFSVSVVQLLMDSKAAAITFTLSIACLAVGDIIKAIKETMEKKP